MQLHLEQLYLSRQRFFSVHWILDTGIFDNGPQYVSEQFR